MDEQICSDRLKIWGGIECTINRVGDEYKDQLEYSGHYGRLGDIEAIADLGIKTIRYPVLWEKHQPKKREKIDWRWSDKQLGAIRASGMKPIVGLMHHGSGPSYTNLLDPEFPYLLAAYAYEVASRYPWIEDYTPVNEPLTTARFSGLYGLWYPHHRSENSFYRMLLNQLKGIVLSMQAIHAVNPSAQLVQTEDLGKTYSTPLLEYQANFENDRRLLTFDILTGLMGPGHPQYDYILNCGIEKEEMDFFQRQRSSPGILGLNYYITSERWIDERLENYPHQTHGGNGIHKYADTEFVRSDLPARGGFKILATEVWERFGIPMAITECHLHCTREEQLRWFKEIWDDSICLKNNGVDLKGLTAWALLGSFDWDSLLTKTGSQYESGTFDIKRKAGQLTPTAMASLLKNLALGQEEQHPVLSEPGWWHASQQELNSKTRPIVIIKKGVGKNADKVYCEKLLKTLTIACDHRRIFKIVADSLREIDLAKLNPWAIIGLNNTNLSIELPGASKHLPNNYIEQGKGKGSLTIFTDVKALTNHQINKVLDFIIDEEEGVWIFGTNAIPFTTENIFDRFPIA